MRYLLAGCLLLVSLDPAVAAEGEDLVITGCLIRAQRDVRIAAEEGGVLFDVPVEEGDRVKAGQRLAQIDDRQAKAALHVAEIALNAAVKRSKDEIDKKYATKAAQVAYVDWQGDVKANEDQRDVVPETEVRRKKLDFERAKLQIERAENERVLAELDADTKRAERDAAQTALDRLTIAAPFDGEVIDVYRDASEWVSPGDPVMRLNRLDVMHVEGFVYAHEFNPYELLNRRVTVEVSLARGQVVSFSGRITHCGQIVDDNDSYLVRAEVENQRDGGIWKIRPGLQSKMTVHINETAAAARAAVK